ncbi:MAG: hypothetical protein ACP5GH_06670 [Nitrososphaeria archaeon]|jgi:hypothetical protein
MIRGGLYSWVAEVVIESDVARVNELLRSGYQLLAIRQQMKQAGNGASGEVTVAFVLGRPKREPDEVWKANPDGSEWARIGEVDPGLLIRVAGGAYVEGGYVYWLSRSRKAVLRRPVRASGL